MCIVTQQVRLSGNEITFTGIALRNWDPKSTITINELMIYGGAGDPLKDLGDVEFTHPTFKSVLPPHNSTRFNTINLFGKGDPGNPDPKERPSQIVIRWSADKKGLELWGNTARVDRQRTPGSPPTIGATRSRGVLRCAAADDKTYKQDNDDES